MEITFNCDKCGQSLEIDEAGAGQLVDCPKCGTPVEVPYKLKPSAATTTPPTAVAEPSSVKFKTCPHCGKDVFATDARCVHCGKTLSDSLGAMSPGLPSYSLFSSGEPLPDSLGEAKAQTDTKASVSTPEKKCDYCSDEGNVNALIGLGKTACGFCGRIIATTQPEQSGGMSYVPVCIIANTLTAIAVLDFIGGVIGGGIIGQDNPQLGWTVFLDCVAGGVFVIAMAEALRYLHKIAHRLENIESIQRKTTK